MKLAHAELCGSQEEILDTVVPRAAANLCLVRDLVLAERGICFPPSMQQRASVPPHLASPAKVLLRRRSCRNHDHSHCGSVLCLSRARLDSGGIDSFALGEICLGVFCALRCQRLIL
jgi:hypothetical protein